MNKASIYIIVGVLVIGGILLVNLSPKISEEEAMIGPKTINLNYVFDGEENYIEFEVYQGLNDYFAEISENEYYGYFSGLSWEKFIMKNINEETQKEFLQPLVKKIKNETLDINDQARIAVSLVQNIPYDKEAIKNDEIELRYPYEVLYDNLGICGDTSILLAFLLRELGFGVVIFEYDLELHRAVGIKCYEEYDYQDTGYCFIETTTQNIITDSEGFYGGENEEIELSSPSEIIYIFDGNYFDVEEDYYDSKRFNEVLEKLKKYEKESKVYEDKLAKYKKDLKLYEEEVYWFEYADYKKVYDKYEELYEEYNEFYEEWNETYEFYEELSKKYGFIIEEDLR